MYNLEFWNNTFFKKDKKKMTWIRASHKRLQKKYLKNEDGLRIPGVRVKYVSENSYSVITQ